MCAEKPKVQACKEDARGTSLVVLWLRLYASTSGKRVQSLVWELQIPQALRYSQKKKRETEGARSLSHSAWKYAGTGALKGYPFLRADLNLERGDPTERPPSKPTYITPFHLRTTWQRGGSDIQGCSGKMSGSCFIHSSLPLVSSVPLPTSRHHH